MADLEFPLGTDFATALVFRDRLGQAHTTLLDSDGLACSVWPGDDLAASFAPALTWIDAGLAKARLDVAAAQTAGLEPGMYRGLATVLRGSETRAGRQFTLELLAVPGSGAARPVYTTADELLLYAPWLAKLQSGSDQAGYREQRARARTWLDSLIQRHWRGDRGYYGGQSPDYSLDYLYDRGRPYRTGAVSTTLQAWLDADRLILSGPTGAQIKEAVARKAISLVCLTQLGAEKETSYQALGGRFAREAEALVSCLTVEIDTTPIADGIGDIAIDLGSCDVLYG